MTPMSLNSGIHPPTPPTPPKDEFDSRTYAIIGAAKEVFRVLGCGYLERVYQLALANEFQRRQVPFESELDLQVAYKGDLLDCNYRIDFLCYGEVIVELKALSSYSGTEEAQVINYLKTSGLDVGLLINFGRRTLEVQRFGMSRKNAESASSAGSADSMD